MKEAYSESFAEACKSADISFDEEDDDEGDEEEDDIGSEDERMNDEAHRSTAEKRSMRSYDIHLNNRFVFWLKAMM